MTQDRWLDLCSKTKDAFPDAVRGTSDLEDRPGQVEFLEFTGPLGRMRLEFTTMALVTSKRATGGHRTGAGTNIQYEYSPTETTTNFKAYRQDNGQWVMIDSSAFDQHAGTA